MLARWLVTVACYRHYKTQIVYGGHKSVIMVFIDTSTRFLVVHDAVVVLVVVESGLYEYGKKYNKKMSCHHLFLLCSLFRNAAVVADVINLARNVICRVLNSTQSRNRIRH